MIGVIRIAAGISSVLLAGAIGSAAMAVAPVGSLCNADGKIEVMSQVAGTPCVNEPDKELKALLKARAAYQDMMGLGPQEKAQIDARIERRMKEIWKIKAASK
ncbi:MAG: hypothetical protein JWP15_3090 [Alphaproteobacteria bacterium]|nr:hypothetical protein [Alphaproteobacteria bacterium]